jgi:hypothetical protein
MGTPSDGKVYAPDEYCLKCGDILIGDEIKKGYCEDCKKSVDKSEEIEENL